MENNFLSLLFEIRDTAISVAKHRDGPTDHFKITPDLYRKISFELRYISQCTCPKVFSADHGPHHLPACPLWRGS